TDPLATENGPTTGIFQITRSGNTSVACTVNYNVSGTAEQLADFARMPGTLTLGPGATTGTVIVTPLENDRSDPNATVILTLAPDNSYAIDPAKGSATVTITDNDAVATGNAA